MNNNPLISVIIPTFNRSYCIERCINSVLTQTYQNLECIIVDNFSTDETDLLISIYGLSICLKMESLYAL